MDGETWTGIGRRVVVGRERLEERGGPGPGEMKGERCTKKGEKGEVLFHYK